MIRFTLWVKGNDYVGFCRRVFRAMELPCRRFDRESLPVALDLIVTYARTPRITALNSILHK